MEKPQGHKCYTHNRSHHDFFLSYRASSDGASSLVLLLLLSSFLSFLSPLLSKWLFIFYCVLMKYKKRHHQWKQSTKPYQDKRREPRITQRVCFGMLSVWMPLILGIILSYMPFLILMSSSFLFPSRYSFFIIITFFLPFFWINWWLLLGTWRALSTSSQKTRFSPCGVSLLITKWIIRIIFDNEKIWMCTAPQQNKRNKNIAGLCRRGKKGSIRKDNFYRFWIAITGPNLFSQDPPRKVQGHPTNNWYFVVWLFF